MSTSGGYQHKRLPKCSAIKVLVKKAENEHQSTNMAYRIPIEKASHKTLVCRMVFLRCGNLRHRRHQQHRRKRMRYNSVSMRHNRTTTISIAILLLGCVHNILKHLQNFWQ